MGYVEKKRNKTIYMYLLDQEPVPLVFARSTILPRVILPGIQSGCFISMLPRVLYSASGRTTEFRVVSQSGTRKSQQTPRETGTTHVFLRAVRLFEINPVSNP
jgi:hypothetical protein